MTWLSLLGTWLSSASSNGSNVSDGGVGEGEEADEADECGEPGGTVEAGEGGEPVSFANTGLKCLGIIDPASVASGVFPLCYTLLERRAQGHP